MKVDREVGMMLCKVRVLILMDDVRIKRYNQDKNCANGLLRQEERLIGLHTALHQESDA
jgi:hypothetical protein